MKNVDTGLIKLQIILEIFFPEDNLIRFEILKTIWDVPFKSNNDENNNYATFLANLLMEWMKWSQLWKGVRNAMSNKSYIIPNMLHMINITTLAA